MRKIVVDLLNFMTIPSKFYCYSMMIKNTESKNIC